MSYGPPQQEQLEQTFFEPRLEMKPDAISMKISPPAPPDQELIKFQEQALECHNKYRERHGAPNLVWSDSLTTGAQAWADKMVVSGKLAHSPAPELGYKGENLANLSGRWDDIAKETITSWYDEVTEYDYENAVYKPKAGHFTQVVWKATTDIGMAYAQTSDGNKTYIVAHYSPPGNVNTQFENNVGPLGQN